MALLKDDNLGLANMEVSVISNASSEESFMIIEPQHSASPKATTDSAEETLARQDVAVRKYLNIARIAVYKFVVMLVLAHACTCSSKKKKKYRYIS